MLKVDHAGEFGAICIYTGQIGVARVRAPHLVSELTEFREHERRHRAIFAAELQRRGQRRCRSYALCGIGGWVLGVVTGLLGPSAIAATTAAVESVVLRHLEEQQRHLLGVDDDALRAISSIVEEERLHHDQALTQVAKQSAWFRMIYPVVAASTECVIWLGMRR
ncbi:MULTISPECIES: demethoxyubiquinone hydroxylase family protein [Dyella]|uniref:Demethoxyubiquinone hydroxylase family protein n=2 Tax=Dyella TaxID=231454 RepID=A0A4R0YZQ9_9GAMM|nr:MULTISPECIES: demethoxyubiquinone hydroxylase family protein [Dyella]TBR39486.1 demethoxyubiquinone hydroxylase family protein [Dyella terrae]TCI12929.1 demethoxyubiquinone hydroxylase family protein [Dyella soli]